MTASPLKQSPTIDIDIDPIWTETIDWEALAAAATLAAATVAPELAHDTMLVSLVMADDDEVQALNKQWRAKDKPTNVLSFPAPAQPRAAEGRANLLGDLVICARLLRSEARAQGKTLRAHWAHLVVHGALHLIGYDHVKTRDERRMQRREISVLKSLGFANPYRSGPDVG